MADGVDRAQALLEGRRAHHRRGHHVTARLQVVRAFVGPGQVLFDQAHPLQGNALAHGMIVRRTEGLQAVGESVHAGSRGDRRRHAHGQLRVADHHDRQHLGMEDDLLFMGRGINEHGRTPDLGARSGRRRHGNRRRNGIGIGAGPPIPDILEIPYGPRLSGHECDRLPQIQP